VPRRRREQRLERVLGAPALFATVYGNVGSSVGEPGFPHEPPPLAVAPIPAVESLPPGKARLRRQVVRPKKVVHAKEA
jgi:hypothetical protein